MHTSLKSLMATLGIYTLLACGTPAAWAEPPLNWTRQGTAGGQAYINCSRGEAESQCGHVDMSGGGNRRDEDKTPFLMETVVVDGKKYIHMIIGIGVAGYDGTQPFGQEIFIGNSTGDGKDCGAGFGTACAYSGGNMEVSSGTLESISGSGWDTLKGDTFVNGYQTGSGNGTGFPTQVVMRTVINDGEMRDEFLKERLAFKPKITQTFSDATFTTTFINDLSNSNYSTKTVPGLMTNTLTFVDPTINGNFDSNATTQTFKTAKAQVSVINGGMYTFVEGAGWTGDNIWQNGSYSYNDPAVGANIANTDWNLYRNAAENTLDFTAIGGPAVTEVKRAGNMCKNWPIPVGC